MPTVRACWVWPGAYVDLTTDATTGRATAVDVHVPDGYTADVMIDLAKRDFSRVFPAGDTHIDVTPPRDIPDGMGIGITTTAV